MSATPVGWPRQVPPPDSDDWESRAAAWLFDHGPADYRTSDFLRRHPGVLAWLVARQVDACLVATRDAYRVTRQEIAELAPDAVAGTLEFLESEGARLLALQRSVHLVRDALTGHRFRPRI